MSRQIKTFVLEERSINQAGKETMNQLEKVTPQPFLLTFLIKWKT